MKIPVVVALMLITVAGPARAQTPPVGTITESRPQVVVADFQSRDGETAMTAFVGTFILLRLQQLEGIGVIRQGGAEGCSVTEQLTALLRDLTRTNVQAAKAPASVGRYGVGGNVRITRRSDTGTPEEFILEYAVDNRSTCSDAPLLKGSEAFTTSTALLVVSAVGDRIASAIEDQTTALRTAVEVSIDADPDARSSFVRALTLRLMDEPDLTLRASSDSGGAFRIEGSASGAGSFRNATFTIVTPDGRRVPVAANPPTAADDAGFYLAAADSAVRGLNQVRYSLHAGVGGRLLSEVDRPTLHRRAEELMCRTMTAGCAPNYRAALGILEGVTNPNARHWQIVGDAALGAGEPLKAADAFDRGFAMASSDSADVRADWARRAANAWYSAGDHERAAGRYGAAIDILVSAGQPPGALLYIRRADSYGLQGDRPAGLGALIDGMAQVKVSEQPALLEALRRHVDGGSGTDLIEAYQRLRMSADTNLIAMALAVAPRVAEEALVLAENDLGAARRWDDADRHLAIVESIPSGAVDAASRRTALRLRAVWHRDSRREFGQAIALLNQAVQTGADAATRYDLAVTHYFRALDGGPQQSFDFRQAVALSADLARERYLLADSLVLDINHRLMRDQDTRTLFQPIVTSLAMSAASSATRRSAVRVLAFACGDYLFDSACAQQAWRALLPIDFEAEPSLQLDMLESDVISRVDPVERLTALTTITSLTTVQRQVAVFYETWASAAAGRNPQAEDAYLRWMSVAAPVSESEWSFEGARRALTGDPRLSMVWRQRMQSMLRQMQPGTAPAR